MANTCFCKCVTWVYCFFSQASTDSLVTVSYPWRWRYNHHSYVFKGYKTDSEVAIHKNAINVLPTSKTPIMFRECMERTNECVYG